MPIVSDPGFDFELVIDDLPRPVYLTHSNDDTDRLFVVLQDGEISILQNDTLFPSPFLDIQDRVNSNGNEQGLLSIAFHPNYSQSGRFFVNYTRRGDGATVISEFNVGSDPDVASSETASASSSQLISPLAIIMAGSFNLDSMAISISGWVMADRVETQKAMAKISPHCWGSLLRIDIDNDDGNAYDVPEDNPFLGTPERSPGDMGLWLTQSLAILIRSLRWQALPRRCRSESI